jgi:hypothetical protein
MNLFSNILQKAHTSQNQHPKEWDAFLDYAQAQIAELEAAATALKSIDFDFETALKLGFEATIKSRIERQKYYFFQQCLIHINETLGLEFMYDEYSNAKYKTNIHTTKATKFVEHWDTGKPAQKMYELLSAQYPSVEKAQQEKIFKKVTEFFGSTNWARLDNNKIIFKNCIACYSNYSSNYKDFIKEEKIKELDFVLTYLDTTSKTGFAPRIKIGVGAIDGEGENPFFYGKRFMLNQHSQISHLKFFKSANFEIHFHSSQLAAECYRKYVKVY